MRKSICDQLPQWNLGCNKWSSAKKRFKVFWGNTQKISHSLGSSFASICVLITSCPLTLWAFKFCKNNMLSTSYLKQQTCKSKEITEFPSSWWPATISEKTKWENFTERIYSPQCYSSSLGMIYCTFISTTHSIFSSFLARIFTGLVALIPTSGVSKHSVLRGLHSQLFFLLSSVSFLFFLIQWCEEANMARTILFLV